MLKSSSTGACCLRYKLASCLIFAGYSVYHPIGFMIRRNTAHQLPVPRWQRSTPGDLQELPTINITDVHRLCRETKTQTSKLEKGFRLYAATYSHGYEGKKTTSNRRQLLSKCSLSVNCHFLTCIKMQKQQIPTRFLNQCFISALMLSDNSYIYSHGFVYIKVTLLSYLTFLSM